MDVLTVILTCSLYTDDALVRAIVDNAHDNPLSILTPELDPETGAASSQPQTLDEAARQVRELTAHGVQPLLGLMQVPVGWASAFGREAQDLFDPCINVSIGSAMLSEFDSACARSKSSPGHRPFAGVPKLRRVCALRRYADGVQLRALTAVVMLELAYQDFQPTLPADAPIFPQSPRQDAWGSDNLLMPPSQSKRPWHGNPAKPL